MSSLRKEKAQLLPKGKKKKEKRALGLEGIFIQGKEPRGSLEIHGENAKKKKKVCD